jgi:hypothetical protein
MTRLYREHEESGAEPDRKTPRENEVAEIGKHKVPFTAPSTTNLRLDFLFYD